MNFAEQMKMLRKQRKMSQEEVACALGISRQAVAKWEQGQSWPDLDNLLQLSDLFQCTVDRLLIEPQNCAKQTEELLQRAGQTELAAFLGRAKRNGYAAKALEERSPSRPGAHDVSYRERDYLYLDSYFGGEQFIGEECVWQKEKPIWFLNYGGRVISEEFSGDFLKAALMLVPEEAPFRGPGFYRDGDYTYICSFSGDLYWYQGHEEIFCREGKVYECFFHGGEIR